MAVRCRVQGERRLNAVVGWYEAFGSLPFKQHSTLGSTSETHPFLLCFYFACRTALFICFFLLCAVSSCRMADMKANTWGLLGYFCVKGTNSARLLRCMSSGISRGYCWWAAHDAVVIDCQWCVNHIAFLSPGTREDSRGRGAWGENRGLEADGQEMWRCFTASPFMDCTSCLRG